METKAFILKTKIKLYSLRYYYYLSLLVEKKSARELM